MAVNATKPGYIWLNGKEYKTNGNLVRNYVSKELGAISIGPSDYRRESHLANWIVTDQRGGLGKEHMDESVDADRYFFSNCITDYLGHLTLPRLATAVVSSAPTAPPVPTITNADFETDVSPTSGFGWTQSAGTWTRSSYRAHGGTYSWKESFISTSDRLSQAVTGFARGVEYTFTCWIYGGAGAKFCIYIIDSNGTTASGSASADGAWTEFTVSRTLALDVTSLTLEVRCTGSGGGTAAYVDDAALTATAVTPGTFVKFANFNGNLYGFWDGGVIAKLNAGRTDMTIVADLGAVTITDAVPSLNSRLYIGLGDSDNYYYMSTAEIFTQSNSANFNWGIQWDAKLFKINTSGAMAYSVDPDDATPTWTTDAAITDIADQIERFEIAKDATGNDIIYCATNSWLLAHNFTDTLWQRTAVKLPSHPNGGKGLVYWHDGLYISYGLGVLRYITGSTATVSEAGLLRDDGLPVEFNGEIVHLLGDSASNDMFALVDASQASGNSKSGLYAYDGRTWKCWWYDSSNDRAMHAAIISSASSGYAVYWDCGGSVYYTDLPRGISNATQLSTQPYAAAGIHILPWFDGGTAALAKLIKRVRSYARNVTTTETIKIYYRTDNSSNVLDLDHSGAKWTLLVTLNATGENGEVETVFASGAGVKYGNIQYRIDLARGGTTTNSPDLQSLVTAYRQLTEGNWLWVARVIVTGKADYENLNTVITSETDVPLYFHDSTMDSDQPHYVKVMLPSGWEETGRNFEGEVTLQMLEA